MVYIGIFYNIYWYRSKVIVPTTTIYIHSLLFTASKTEKKWETNRKKSKIYRKI